jgi:hypothetical protein
MINIDETALTALRFDVALDHGDWLEAVRRMVAPADLDLFEVCADRGFALHPPSVLVHMGEVLDYTPEEIGNDASWLRAMALVDERCAHPSTTAFADFVHSVDAQVAAVAPPHEDGPYVEVIDQKTGADWVCPSFTFLDALYWATSATSITAIDFAPGSGPGFAEVIITGADVVEVSELHVASDAVRDALARHNFEHVDSGADDVLRHLNASTDDHCRDLFAGTHTHRRCDIWALEEALRRN